MWQLELNKHSRRSPIRRELHGRSAAMIIPPLRILPETYLGGCSIFFFSPRAWGIWGPEGWRGPVGWENTTGIWQDWGSFITGHGATHFQTLIYSPDRGALGFLSLCPFEFYLLSWGNVLVSCPLTQSCYLGQWGSCRLPWWWWQHVSLPENHSTCEIFSEHPFTSKSVPNLHAEYSSLQYTVSFITFIKIESLHLHLHAHLFLLTDSHRS